VCGTLGLSVYLDATNLSRIYDEQRLKLDVLASRLVVAIISRDALVDPHGMQQELWWAEGANVPVVPFYDGDRHAAQDYDSWQKEFGLAMHRPPVVYRRQAHLRVK
ncbi:unnamed protein product, partial [Polarella glacialis]